MSFKSITFALALTASFTHAEKMRLSELMNLQNEVVRELDLGHTEPEVDHRGDSKHREHIIHQNEVIKELDLGHTEPEVDHRGDSKHREHIIHQNDADWEEFHGGADEHCPIGYERVGCCKCVRDLRHAEEDIGGIDHPHDQVYNLDANHHDKAHSLETEHTNSESDFHGQMYGYHQPGYRHDEGVWKLEGHFAEHEARGLDHDHHYEGERNEGQELDRQSRQGQEQRQDQRKDERQADRKDQRQDDKQQQAYRKDQRQDERKDDRKDQKQDDRQRQADLKDQRQDDRQKQADRKDQRQDERKADRKDQRQDDRQKQADRKDQRQDDRQTKAVERQVQKDDRQDARKSDKDTRQGDERRGSQSEKPKLTMHTSEEQAKSKQDPKPTQHDKKGDSQKAKTEEKSVSYEKKSSPDVQCPKGFTYESKERKDSAPWKIEACRMPMSYDLGSGYEHHCTDCHYSFGRWLDRCAENYVRNGCCTCTPHCPEGMVLDLWLQEDVEVNNYVCLIRSFH